MCGFCVALKVFNLTENGIRPLLQEFEMLKPEMNEKTL